MDWVKIKQDRLIAKVNAFNSANQYGKFELYPKLKAVFEPYIGQKILKADGTLLAKIANQMPELPSTPKMHVYRFTSQHSLMWVAKACELCGEHSCQYAEASIYIGELLDGVLTKICTPPELRTDYSTDEILKKRETYQIAKKASDEAQSALYPFGEMDM